MTKTKKNTNIIHNSGEKLDKTLILNRIKSHYKFKFDAELARFLGVNESAFGNWRSRNIIKLELLITKCADLNPNWIINGQGRPTKEYDNFEENLPSLVEEEKIDYVRQQDEIDHLHQVIIAQEKTIAAQAKTIEVMGQLIGKKE